MACSTPSPPPHLLCLLLHAPTGRILIAQGGVDSLKIGLFNAIRYSCQRPQFGDKVIMSYVTHQQRLLPLLANTYALHLAMGSLKVGGQGRVA